MKATLMWPLMHRTAPEATQAHIVLDEEVNGRHFKRLPGYALCSAGIFKLEPVQEPVTVAQICEKCWHRASHLSVPVLAACAEMILAPAESG